MLRLRYPIKSWERLRSRHFIRVWEMSRPRLYVKALTSTLSHARWAKLSQLIDGPDHLKSRDTFFSKSIISWSRSDKDHVPAMWPLPDFSEQVTDPDTKYSQNRQHQGLTLIFSYSFVAITKHLFSYPYILH